MDTGWIAPLATVVIFVLIGVCAYIFAKHDAKVQALTSLCWDDSRFVANENERLKRAGREDELIDLKEWAEDRPRFSKHWGYLEENWGKVEEYYSNHVRNAPGVIKAEEIRAVSPVLCKECKRTFFAFCAYHDPVAVK